MQQAFYEGSLIVCQKLGQAKPVNAEPLSKTPSTFNFKDRVTFDLNVAREHFKK